MYVWGNVVSKLRFEEHLQLTVSFQSELISSANPNSQAFGNVNPTTSSENDTLS